MRADTGRRRLHGLLGIALVLALFVLPAAAQERFVLSPGEQAFLRKHPVLTVAYGKPWEPLLQMTRDHTLSGVSVMLLNRLTEWTNVTLRYEPLETAAQIDMLSCVPNDDTLSQTAQIQHSKPYMVLPMALVTTEGQTDVASAAAVEGFRPSPEIWAVPLVYYPDAGACLEAVLSGEQPAAFLNTYASSMLLQNKRYAKLVEHHLPQVSVEVCFGVPQAADPRLLSILNKLIDATGPADTNNYLIAAVLENQTINLSTIAARRPTDVMVALAVFSAVLAALLILTVSHSLRTRRERAQATEVAAFLDYATKINEYVWEVDITTHRRWRYHVQQGHVTRMPLPEMSQALLARYVHPADLPFVIQKSHGSMNASFIDMQRQDRFECRLLDKDGAYRWMRVVFQGILPTRTHPNCVMVYIMDVDDTIKAEEKKSEQLKDALAQAEAASIAKSEFTAYLSHEIRSPLNAMLGYLTLAKSSTGNRDRLSECFIKSEHAANHLLQLINAALDMGTISSGHLLVVQESFDLHAMLDTIAAIQSAQAKTRGIFFKVDVPALHYRYLIGDVLRVKQIIVNLISNALKFTAKGGFVTVTTLQTQTALGQVRVHFTVQDTGIGMSEAFQARLFSAYAQQDVGIAGHYGGNGLGLAICKQLAELMGGSIAVQSVQGKGTSITVDIPFAADTARCHTTADDKETTLRFAGKRLLLAEDNAMNLEIASDLLHLEGGFTIDAAINGQEASQKFITSAPGTYDAVLMDVRMPVLDGYAATRAIRRSSHPQASTIPIIAMTADAFAEDVQRAMQAGMNAHIAKPIAIHHVLATLHKLLLEPLESDE